MRKKKSVGQQSMPQKRNSFGIGYIALPQDQDRDKFISHCLRNYTVSIMTENSEFINNVKIGLLAIQLVEFPETSKEYGSMVGWANYPKHNQPVIVDVYAGNDTFSTLSEHEFRLMKSTDGGTAVISGNAKDGKIFIGVDNDSESEVNIHAVNKNQDATINLFAKGAINLSSVGKIYAKGTDEIFIELNAPDISENHYIRIIKGDVELDGPKMYFGIKGEAKEHPMVLGDVLFNLLKDFFSTIGTDVVTTALGPMPLSNFIKYQGYLPTLMDILSKSCYVKK